MGGILFIKMCMKTNKLPCKSVQIFNISHPGSMFRQGTTKLQRKFFSGMNNEKYMYGYTCTLYICMPLHSVSTFIASIITKQLTAERNVHYVLIRHFKYSNCCTLHLNQANNIFAERRKLEKTFSFIGLISLH